MAHESRRMPTWLVDHSSQTDSESGCMTITVKCDPVFPSDESLQCCTYDGCAIPKSQYDGCILHSSVYFENINQRFVINVLDISFLPRETQKKSLISKQQKTQYIDKNRFQMALCDHTALPMLSVYAVWFPSVPLSISSHLSICLCPRSIMHLTKPFRSHFLSFATPLLPCPLLISRFGGISDNEEEEADMGKKMERPSE